MMSKITYKTAGVDIHQANVFVKSIQGLMKATSSPAVIKDRGAFGSLFSLDVKKYKNPVLVSSTDGVGTKLLIAQAVNQHDTVGIDLVAMNVNDVLCTGAKPLFFLDYIACGKVKPKVFKDVMKGIANGCRQAGCSLVGGETAEMPGMYNENEYDLAGFSVGIVDKNKIIDGSGIQNGDVAIGLASSGLHSNGFSLARKVLGPIGQKKWAKELLTPTRIYVREVLSLLEKFEIRGIAHITGGAFYEKLTKVLPSGKCFEIDRGSWPVPEIFQIIQKQGKIAGSEMHRTFNMGIGLVLVVDPQSSSKVMNFVKRSGCPAFEIGRVIKGKNRKIVFRE